MMQSVVVYGRILTRALVSGIYNKQDLRKREPELVTAWSGFPKELVSSSLLRRHQFGDDACFVAKHKSADVLGVADGVGGWRMYGIDPSLFSTSLMKRCEHLVRTGSFNPCSPASIIAKSYYELLESKEQILGSSTACVIVLNRADCTIYTANLGDSGFLVVRAGKVVHRSEDQQHYFNTPFQLSWAPHQQSGQVLSDSPESADITNFIVKDGDLILVGTDGLFDNLPDSMIVEELAKLQKYDRESMQKTANSLALQARSLAFDSNYISPFALRAMENGIDAIGGKPDDITVLLATVNL